MFYTGEHGDGYDSRRRVSGNRCGVATTDLPRNAGYPFYERLNRILSAAGFDAFVEGLCARFYTGLVARLGGVRASPPPREQVRTRRRLSDAGGGARGPRRGQQVRVRDRRVEHDSRRTADLSPLRGSPSSPPRPRR